ncbi:hypothetical protein [Methanosarcina sp. WWM596]|uniref:hypothetical protein n=1 Tax=Methanosarcina sp. WWM596 TaxID=1434103 RepID=UPI00064FEDC7|nr:hypothetical protein [Methanosarcina sp. WWM596]
MLQETHNSISGCIGGKEGTTVFCIKCDNGSMVPSSHDVVMDVTLAVFVNGHHALIAMVSPTMLEEFVTGFLYTEWIKNEEHF